MTEYFNSLVAVILLSEITAHLSPDNTSAKKSVRLVCSLAVLLVMLSPVKKLVSFLPDVKEKAEAFFSSETEEAEESDGLSDAAGAIIKYLDDSIGRKARHSSVTFVTNENDSVVELQLFLPMADEETRWKVENALGHEMNISVRVFCGDNTATGGDEETLNNEIR